MSVYSFFRDSIAIPPALSAIAGGTTTTSGSLFFKIFSQNLAGNNFGSNSAQISWTAGQQVRIQIPATMRATGEFVERFSVAASTTGNSGTWVQLAVVDAMDTNGAVLALPISVDLSSNYDLNLAKAAATSAALPTTAKLGALTTIASLGAGVYRFETAWPIPADGVTVIQASGGFWVKHYATFNPEPVSMIGAQGQRQPNSSVTTATKLVGYAGGSYSRSFYYSIFNSSSNNDLAAGTNIGLTVLADGQPRTADFSNKIEVTLVGYVDNAGVLNTAPAIGLPSLLYDYTNIGQIYLPANLPANSQAVYRLRFNYSAIDFSQPLRSVVVNLEPYAVAPVAAPWAALAGDSFIADSGGKFRFYPGLGLSGQVDDGQITVNKFQSPVTVEQTVVGFASATSGQLAIANASGQVLRQPGGYTPGSGEILLATVGTIAGEHRKLNLGSVTLASAGGVNVTVGHPVDGTGRATVRSNYSDSRIASVVGGFCRFNPLNVIIYLTNGGTTYRSAQTPLNQTSQVITISAPGTTVSAPTTNAFGLFDPVSASATTTTGTIPAGTYQISIGYEYDGNQITAIAHNSAFPIYNGNAAGLVAAHETAFNHASFLTSSALTPYLTQTNAASTYLTQSNAASTYLTQSNATSTYLTQANAATLYKPLTTDDSVATGLRYALKTAQTGTPASGEVQFNNATLASVTQLLISETGRDGSTIANLMDLIVQTSRIIIQSEQSEGTYAWFQVSGAPVDNGAYRTIPVTFVTAPTGVTTVAGLGASAAELTLDFYGSAGSGSGGGATGLRFTWNSTVFSSSTTNATTGQIRIDNAAAVSATALSISVIEQQSGQLGATDLAGVLGQMLKNGKYIAITKDATNRYVYKLASNFVANANGNGSWDGTASAAGTIITGTIANGDTVFLSSLVEPVSAAGGGGGLTWSTITDNASVSEGQGILANFSSEKTIELPAGTESGQPIVVSGVGVAVFNVQRTGGLVFLADGTSGVGLKRGTNRYTSVQLKAVSPNVWIAQNVYGNVTLISAPVDTRAQTYFNALTAAAYTPNNTEMNAFTIYLQAIDAISSTLWSKIIFLYPIIGNSAACHFINAKDPGQGSLFNSGATLVHTTSGMSFTSGSVSIGNAYLAPLMLSTDFRYMSVYLENYNTTTGEIIIGASGGAYRLYLYQPGNRINPGIDSLTTEVSNITPALLSTYSGEIAMASIPSAGSISGRGYLGGQLKGTTPVNTRSGISNNDLEIKNTGGKIKFLLGISRNTHLTDSEILALYNANQAFQTALGRAN